ncbi:hypothetical protein Tco_1505658 [Tanacetum coccineum]
MLASWAAPFRAFVWEKIFDAPICWDEVGERLIEGPELIEITNEKVAVAKEKLNEARSRQKSYADKHRLSVLDSLVLFEILEVLKRFRIVWRSSAVSGRSFVRRTFNPLDRSRERHDETKLFLLRRFFYLEESPARFDGLSMGDGSVYEQSFLCLCLVPVMFVFVLISFSFPVNFIFRGRTFFF